MSNGSGISGLGFVTEVTGRSCFITGYLPSTHHTNRNSVLQGKVIYETHLKAFLIGCDFPNTARWAKVEFVPIDYIEERTCDIIGYLWRYDYRNCIIIPETRVKFCYIFGKPSKGPQIIKYPKYFNWKKVPRTFYLDCQILSFAEVDWETLLVHVNSESGFSKNYTIHTIENGINTTEYELIYQKNSIWIYNLKVHFYHVFEENEKINVKIYLADKFGNILEKEMV